MTAAHVGGAALSKDLISKIGKPCQINRVCKPFCSGKAAHSRNNLVFNDQKKVLSNVCECHHLSAKHATPVSPLVRVRHRRGPISNALSSDCGLGSDVKETYNLDDNDVACRGSKEGFGGCTDISGNPSEDAKRELVMLSLPAIAGQAIEPLAQLMETAYIGRLGPVQLGSAGVSISIFNIISKLFNIPLLSVATSFVAEDISKSIEEDSTSEGGHSGNGTDSKLFVTKRKQLSSVSTALLLAVGIGLFEAIALCLGSGLFLHLMGITSASPMHGPAQKFLSLRALGAPAVVVSLALQGVFRGFKDTKTPVFCLGVGNFVAVLLFPILMYYFQLGVTGAAISTVSSQYIVAFLMIWYLNKKAVLLPPELGGLDFSGYLKSGGYLIGRTLAVLVTMTLGTSMAARQGPIAMAAHQICLQVWLSVSLLTDALASSGQVYVNCRPQLAWDKGFDDDEVYVKWTFKTLIASNVSKGDYKTVREITLYVLKIGVITGVSLAIILGLSFGFIATLFTKDADVLRIVRTGLLFVSASQPINSLAFIFDGLHYGVSDFPYAACSMMAVGAISSAFLLYAPSTFGLYGVWSGLALFMTLRTAAGFNRILSKTGPWWFLHKEFQTTEA